MKSLIKPSTKCICYSSETF